MDALSSLLKKEIEKKKKKVQEIKDIAPEGYIRNGDLEKLTVQRKELLEENKKKKRSNSPSSAVNEEINEKKQKTRSKLKETEEETVSNVIDIPSEEIVRGLRAKGEPIRLFGETDVERFERLKLLETIEADTGGQTNQFMIALDEAESSLNMEVLKADTEESSKKLLKEKLIMEEDTSLIDRHLLKSNPDKCVYLIGVYIKRLLIEWDKYLANRPESVKRSTQGRLAAATQKQTIQYLKPFFKQLKKKQIEPDVINHIAEIIELMQKREYIKANHIYLQLSIGNAPWPIGVTMVGIHERSAREKIFSNQVAHVLNDESQRKWIQSIKRLMTFCQNRYPPDDLSQCVG